MHPVTQMSISSAHLAGIDPPKKKKKKALSTEQKELRNLKKALAESNRKIHRLMAEQKARDEFPIKISKSTYELHQKEMVKDENLISYALRKAVEVELLKEEVAALKSEQWTTIGWAVPINGTYELFKSHEAAQSERREFEDTNPNYPDSERLSPTSAYVRTT